MSSGLICTNSVDTFHTWPIDDPDWTETLWFGAWIPEALLTIYVYRWFRPVLHIHGGGCLIWDDQYWLPWDLPVFHYDVNRPITGDVDLRDMRLDGTTLRTLKEGRVYQIDYDRGNTLLSMQFESTSQPEITDNTGTEEFFSGHLDQAGHYTGTLEIEGKVYEIDCHGIRDRSWGSRVITDDIRLGYCHGQAEDFAFLAYSKPPDETIFKGYIQRYGQRKALQGGRRTLQFADGKLQSIELELITVGGERIHGLGRPLNRFAYMPYPNLLTWLYLVRWEIDGRVVYGEEQDAWSLPIWREHIRNNGWRG